MKIDFPPLWAAVDHAIVHCSATPASMDVGASWIDKVHRQRGWSMCGYHIVIRRDGTIEWSGIGSRTRPWGRTGSHVGGCGHGWNERSIGICLIGGVKEDGRTPEDNFTDPQWTALRKVLDELIALGIPTDNVMGHRDLIKQTNAAPKACPCFSTREWYFGDEPHGGVFNWLRDKRPNYSRGEKLKTPKSYTVREGDSLWRISRTYGVPLWKLRELNASARTDDTIHPGQRLRLTN